MKIGIVCYPTFGGSGVVATELGKALAQKGNEIHFITYNMPVRLSDSIPNVFYHEVSIADYPLFDFKPYELALTSKLVDVVKYEKLDLLHVHYAIPHASAAYMAQHILEDQGIKIPFVTTLHGTDITLVGKDPSIEPVITFSIKHSDAVTAVSESLKQDTLKYFEVNRPIEVIPNFVCLDNYPREINKLLKKKYAKKDEKIVMHISNFRKVKRVNDVVKAFYEINCSIPSQMIFIGDGPERHNAEMLCRKLGISENTHFVGKVSAVEQMLSIADIFMLPSETESFGLAALEAMACGVPVISTNTGGLSEVNIHGNTGYLTEVGDIKSLADYSLAILKDDKILKEFRENALTQAAAFDVKNILPAYEKIYNSLLSK